MGLRVGSDLLSSCRARLQPWSSLEADTGVSWGPSSWQNGTRGKPLWHLHGNFCPWAEVLGSSIPELAGDELPGLWARVQAPGAGEAVALQRQTLQNTKLTPG